MSAHSPLVEQEMAVAGGTARYLVAGEGPPVVLLHGNGDSKFSWSWVLPRLARTHRVYALDLPGFSDSSPQPADLTPARFARFVTDFLDALAIDRATIVGSSLGGLVALRVALAAPERVAGLGLLDSAGLGYAVSPLVLSLAWSGAAVLSSAWDRTPLGSYQRRWVRATCFFTRPDRVPSAWYAEQDRLNRCPGFSDAVITTLRGVTTWSGQRDVLLPELRRLSLPTLVLWGAHDLIFPAWQAYTASACLPGGRLAIIPGCGHLPHVECPEQTADALASFLTVAGVGSRPVARRVSYWGGW